MITYIKLSIFYILLETIGYKIIKFIFSQLSKYDYFAWVYYFYYHDKKIIFFWYLYFIFTTSIFFTLILWYKVWNENKKYKN